MDTASVRVRSSVSIFVGSNDSRKSVRLRSKYRRFHDDPWSEIWQLSHRASAHRCQ